LDTVQVQGESAEGGIVRVGKGIDDGMEGVAADDIIIMF
jgi:hypothetical protein